MVQSCSDKTHKMANVKVDRCRTVELFANWWKFTRKIIAHDEREVCNMGGGTGHDCTMSENQSAHALRGQRDHPTQGAALISITNPYMDWVKLEIATFKFWE